MAGQEVRREAMEGIQELQDNLNKARHKLAMLHKTCEKLQDTDDDMGGWFDGVTDILWEIMGSVDEAMFFLDELKERPEGTKEAETV
jgi:hypothetical protein